MADLKKYIIQSIHSILILPLAVLLLFLFYSDFCFCEVKRHPPLISPIESNCIICHKKINEHELHTNMSEKCIKCHCFDKTEGATTVNLSENVECHEGSVLKPEIPEIIRPDSETDPVHPDENHQSLKDAGVTYDSDGASYKAEHEYKQQEKNADSNRNKEVYTSKSVTPKQLQKAADRTILLRKQQESGNFSEPLGDLYYQGVVAFFSEDYNDASILWHKMLEMTDLKFSLQIEVDQEISSITSTLDRYFEFDLYYLEKDKGYVVLSGLFTSKEDAFKALEKLPEKMKKANPFPIAVDALQQ